MELDYFLNFFDKDNSSFSKTFSQSYNLKLLKICKEISKKVLKCGTKNKLISTISEIKTFSVFDALKKITKGLINRHDVDWSIDDAYTLSQLELDNGINSTYYIRLNSDLYNPKSRKNKIILKKMKNFLRLDYILQFLQYMIKKI